MNDPNILDQDAQRLAAARVWVSERLAACREALRTHGSLDPAKVMPERAIRAAIAVLEPLADILGIDSRGITR